MAATDSPLQAQELNQKLSVPLSSGQWLQPLESTGIKVIGCPFQSPCHRVNGCNGRHGAEGSAEFRAFSPLVIGSMAATILYLRLIRRPRSFSPLVIGSMAATELTIICWRSPNVPLSVPLSSGQWLQLWLLPWLYPWVRLSVPLSSGQWLQLYDNKRDDGNLPPFSPLVIGSMAATQERRCHVPAGYSFQSPCHRVNGCNNPDGYFGVLVPLLSVPLSSGQWLQRFENPFQA